MKRIAMHRLLMTVSLTACLFAPASSRAEETYASRRETSPDDSKAILQVLTKFLDAIKTKNPKALSTLVLNDNILFSKVVDSIEKQMINDSLDVNFDGIRYGATAAWLNCSARAKRLWKRKSTTSMLRKMAPSPG